MTVRSVHPGLQSVLNDLQRELQNRLQGGQTSEAFSNALQKAGEGFGQRNSQGGVASSSGATSSEGVQSSRWGEWTEIDGKQYRQVFPPGTALKGAPSYYVDEAGTWYARPTLPGAKLSQTEKPSWAPVEGPGSPEDVEEEPVKPFDPVQWGDWMQIGGASYREVLPPGMLRGGGTKFFVDEEGNWFKSLPVDSKGGETPYVLQAIKQPSWFSGWDSTTAPTEEQDQLTALLEQIRKLLLNFEQGQYAALQNRGGGGDR